MQPTTHRTYQGTILVLVGIVIGLLVPRNGVAPAHAGDADVVPDVIKAKRFELVSPEGKKAAELVMLPRQGGPHLILYGSTGTAIFDCGVVVGDEPQLLINDALGKMVLNFQLDPNRRPSISFFDGGALRTKVGVGPMGHAILGLSGRDRATRAAMAVAEDGTPLFEAYDKDEKSIWRAP